VRLCISVSTFVCVRECVCVSVVLVCARACVCACAVVCSSVCKFCVFVLFCVMCFILLCIVFAGNTRFSVFLFCRVFSLLHIDARAVFRWTGKE
jgi:hypothetical protein